MFKHTQFPKRHSDRRPPHDNHISPVPQQQPLSPTSSTSQSNYGTVPGEDGLDPTRISPAAPSVTPAQSAARAESPAVNMTTRYPGNLSLRKRFHGADTFKKLGKSVVAARRLANHTLHAAPINKTLAYSEPGAAPGVDSKNEMYTKRYESVHALVNITVTDYSADNIQVNADLGNDTIEAFLKQPRPAWSKVRWINCQGLSWDVLKALSIEYELHPLAIEDVLHVPQKIKVDRYEDHMYLSLMLLSLEEPKVKPVEQTAQGQELRTDRMPNRMTGSLEDWRKYSVNVEQTSIFLLKNGTLITFFHQEGSIVSRPVMHRLQQEGLLIRTSEDASFLLHSVVDTIVDHTIPVVEYYNSEISRLEAVVLGSPEMKYTKYLHVLQGELALLRRTLIPTKFLLHNLRNTPIEQGNFISTLTRIYLNDVQDHADTVVENIDTLNAWTKDLIDLIFNMIAYQTNESMKTLAVISAAFLPITFVAGVYDMPFDGYKRIHDFHALTLVVALFTGVLAFFKFRRSVVAANTLSQHRFHKQQDPASPIPASEPGSPPGIDAKDHRLAKLYQHIHSAVKVTVVDYSAYNIQVHGDLTNETFESPLIAGRPTWSKIEDVLHVPQRIKLDRYDDHIYLSLTLLSLAHPNNAPPPPPPPAADEQGGCADSAAVKSCMQQYHANVEQVSVFLTKDGTVISIFHHEGGIITRPIKDRLQHKDFPIRYSEDASFLMNALLDAVVDHVVPVVNYYDDEIRRLESLILDRPSMTYIKYLHVLQGELTILRQTLLPTQNVINSLLRADHDRIGIITAFTRTYLRDVQDHADTLAGLINSLTTWSKAIVSLTVKTFNITSYEANMSMKTFAALSAVFLPLTFLAGVYGTNFDNLPELRWRYGYLSFWCVVSGIFVVGIARAWLFLGCVPTRSTCRERH
ncbi:hypothetical protein RI367_001690 [Sorochytrium milnesiophthora]